MGHGEGEWTSLKTAGHWSAEVHAGVKHHFARCHGDLFHALLLLEWNQTRPGWPDLLYALLSPGWNPMTWKRAQEESIRNKALDAAVLLHTEAGGVEYTQVVMDAVGALVKTTDRKEKRQLMERIRAAARKHLAEFDRPIPPPPA